MLPLLQMVGRREEGMVRAAMHCFIYEKWLHTLTQLHPFHVK
jgi:hypothetical protein